MSRAKTISPTIDPETVSAVMRMMGAKGGKNAAGRGAAVATANMTPEERTNRARTAAEARWGKRKRKAK
jgi:hypothetical protein